MAAKTKKLSPTQLELFNLSDRLGHISSRMDTFADVQGVRTVAAVVDEHSRRLTLLEKESDRQSPSEKALFSKVKGLQIAVEHLLSEKPRHEGKSPREQWLERENDWLRSEIAHYREAS